MKFSSFLSSRGLKYRRSHFSDSFRLVTPFLESWDKIERELSEEEKKHERGFFRKFFFFLFFSFLITGFTPYIQRIDPYFWPIPQTEGIFSDYFIMADEGYFAKANVPTIQSSDRSDVHEVIEYTIQRGDTISHIAKRFNVTSKTILENNDIVSINFLKTGQILLIPPVDGLIFRVGETDTLESIAKTYEINVSDIRRQNQLAEATVLEKGKQLILPGAKKPEPKAVIAIQPQPKTTNITKTNNQTPVSNNVKTSPVSTPVVSIPSSSPSKLIFPTTGNITQYYHYGHYALDIANVRKPPVIAAADGVVIKAATGWNSGYGNVIIIDHGGGMQTLYGHNEELYVSEGQNVTAGQVISKMGNSGKVYGPTGIHVHFEVRINGDKKNPLQYF